MKYPRLVPDAVCTTPIEVTIFQEGISEEGAPIEDITVETLCNYQDTAKRIYKANKEFAEITGRCFINDDIAPGLAIISAGKVTVNGMEREIAQGTKARNLDGSVNYTLLELI